MERVLEAAVLAAARDLVAVGLSMAPTAEAEAAASPWIFLRKVAQPPGLTTVEGGDQLVRRAQGNLSEKENKLSHWAMRSVWCV